MSTRAVLGLAIAALMGAAGVATLSASPASRPAEPAPGQAQTPPAPTQPTFRVAIDLVTTDVIVRDKSGQFLADLGKRNFEILEDGVKQEVASLVLIHGGRVYSQDLPPPPPPQEGIILPPTRPSNDAAGRIFILFVDDLHLDFKNTPRIKNLFKRIATTLVHEGDMFAIISTGPSSVAIGPTYDRKRLDEAVKKIAGHGLSARDILEAPDGAEGPSEVRYRAHVAFSTAYDMLNNLERIQNRRKAFVYVSNGYDFDPFPEARAGRDREFRQGPSFDTDTEDPNGGSALNPFAIQAGGKVFADADLVAQLAELTRAANRANTSLYTIDPRGLIGYPDMDDPVNPVEFMNYVRKSQDSLRVLAEQTGGLAIVNQNDFTKALKRIDAETSDYYVLGYYSNNPDPTKRTRRIEVKILEEKDGQMVPQSDVEVWSRRTYTLKPPPVPLPVSSQR